jgi:HEPN domain-containing protein
MSSNFDVLKNSVVTEMFVDTADQNYLIARWAYHRGLFIDFFWNSVHALEKFFKASLLLNGKSAIGFGHDLTRLYH